MLRGSEVSRIISPPRVVTSITHRSFKGSVMFKSFNGVLNESTPLENTLATVVVS
jgi:hypothetical protein